MRRGSALGDVTQRVPQRGQPANLCVDIVGAPVERLARQSGDALPAENAFYFLERESGQLAQGYQGKLRQRLRTVLAPQSTPPERFNKPDLLVVAQRGSRHATLFSQYAYIQKKHT